MHIRYAVKHLIVVSSFGILLPVEQMPQNCICLTRIFAYTPIFNPSHQAMT